MYSPAPLKVPSKEEWTMTARSALIVFAIAIVMIVPAGAFLGMIGGSKASPGSTILRIGFSESIDSLNPYLGMNDASQILYSLVYDSLTGVGGDLNPVPCLAQEWRVVPDQLPYGSVWEYNLSAGAEWSDGVPVTAEDIAWNINLNCEPANYSMMWAFQPYSFFMQYAEVVDVDTVRIHFWDRMMATPMPVAFGDSILIPMLPRHLLGSMASWEISFMWSGDPIVGSGPFLPSPTLYDDWIAGDAITLLRNPDYHGGPNYGRYVQFDKLEFHFFAGSVAMREALENNEIDVAGLPFDEFDALRDRIDLGIVTDVQAQDSARPDGYWEEVLINMRSAGPNPSRLDPTIRHAMAMATDKSYILNQFYLGEGEPGSTLISSISKWHYDLGIGEEYAFDIAAANSLLQTAGYVDINADGIRECTSTSWAYLQGYVVLNRPLQYQMLTRMEHPEELQIAAFLESQWALIGVDLQWSVYDEATMASIVYAYNYDTAIWYWDMDPDPSHIFFSQSNRSWNGWSDTLYSSPAFEENYTLSVTEMDPVARETYVDICQRVHYQDTPYIIFAYLNDTYGWRTDTFSGWGDWDSSPGRSITAAWSGNPLYFELVPLVEYNSPPSDVSLDAQPVFGDVGTPIDFTARAMDADGDNLSFYIDYGDGTGDLTVSTGPMYSVHEVSFSHTYLSEGTILVTVWVDDGAGTPEANVSASTTVTIFQEGQRRVSYEWYDLFNVPTGEWWDVRYAIYGSEEPLTNAYPYLFRVERGVPGDFEYMTSMRLDVSAQNLSEINMDSRPQFLPLLGSERGGNASINWYMQYLTSAEVASHPGNLSSWNDGWMNQLNGTVVLDLQAAKAVMNLTDTDLEDFSGWWANNSASFQGNYIDWLDYEGNDRLDIYPAYEWPWDPLYFSIEAEKVGETVVLTYDIVSWGGEILMARWLRDAFMPTEWVYEDFRLTGSISPTSADLDISTAVELAATAWETTLVPDGEMYGLPCWVWAGQLLDYMPSNGPHPYSDYDDYSSLDRISLSPASALWHDYVPFYTTPTAWNLSAAETLSFEWPSGDQLFYVHDPWMPYDPVEVSGPMTVLYSEPMEMDMPSQVSNSQATRTLSFTGPFDMWTWSHDQVRHEHLSSEWNRLGVLPYGMPWIEFQIDSGLNTPPTALFSYDPEFGDVTTVYSFNATDSWDLESLSDSLEVRWDWNGDGTYDTGWSTSRTVDHQFTSAGTYDVTLQVRDSQGLTDTKVIQIVVVEIIPEFPILVMPILAVALLVLIFRSRRRR